MSAAVLSALEAMRNDRERDDLRDVLASFLDRTQGLDVVRASLDEGYDRTVWSRLSGELGLTGVGLPASVGGSGEGVSDLVAITEQLGRRLDPGPFLPSIVLAAQALASAGGADDLLEQLAAGTATATMALQDGQTDLTVVGRHDTDGVVVDGSVRHVLHAGSADHLLLVAELPDGPTLVVLPTSGTGVLVTMVDAVDPTRPMGDVRLTAAPATVLGSPGGAADVLEPVMRLARVALASELVGVAEGALDLTVAYAREREQFGRAIGSFQSIKHLLVDVMMEIEASRAAVRAAAAAIDDDAVEALELSHVCKAVASDAAVAAGKAAVQVHGAIGFTWEHDAHLYLKRALGGARLLGSARDHRQHVATLVLDNATTATAARPAADKE